MLWLKYMKLIIKRSGDHYALLIQRRGMHVHLNIKNYRLQYFVIMLTLDDASVARSATQHIPFLSYIHP